MKTLIFENEEKTIHAAHEIVCHSLQLIMFTQKNKESGKLTRRSFMIPGEYWVEFHPLPLVILFHMKQDARWDYYEKGMSVL